MLVVFTARSEYSRTTMLHSLLPVLSLYHLGSVAWLSLSRRKLMRRISYIVLCPLCVCVVAAISFTSDPSVGYSITYRFGLVYSAHCVRITFVSTLTVTKQKPVNARFVDNNNGLIPNNLALNYRLS